MGGELAGIRTQDPRLKRALLYQLSYELVQGRSFKTNTGDELPPVEVFRAFIAIPAVFRDFSLDRDPWHLGNHRCLINGNHAA